jgi:hypothetical protein
MIDCKQPTIFAGPRPATRPKSCLDIAACRLKRSEFGDNLECLSPWKQRCPYGIPFGTARFCSNPIRREILAHAVKGVSP